MFSKSINKFRLRDLFIDLYLSYFFSNQNPSYAYAYKPALKGKKQIHST